MSIESVMPSNHLILCNLLLLLPSIFPSIRVFSNESVLCIRWPKCWSFSFSISASNEYSGLISFRIDWLDLLATQGTLKSLLQNHRTWAPPSAHLRLDPTDQASDSLSSLTKWVGCGVSAWQPGPGPPGVPVGLELYSIGSSVSGWLDPLFLSQEGALLTLEGRLKS